MKKGQTTRDPIKRPALRNPGHSLERQLRDAVDDRVISWYLLGAFAFLYAVFEWTRWFTPLPLGPWFISLAAVGVIAFAALRIRAAWADIARLKTGLKGEKYVGHFLQNALLRKGYWVVHDVPDEAGNIDHVLIGPGGVFSIETKTRSKPKGDARVQYDGTTITVAGQTVDRNPVAQARACADSLQRILLEYTGQKTSVRPVVLFPGWYVENQPRGCDVWVLNEKNLVGFLKNGSSGTLVGGFPGTDEMWRLSRSLRSRGVRVPLLYPMKIAVHRPIVLPDHRSIPLAITRPNTYQRKPYLAIAMTSPCRHASPRPEFTH